ncbi:MAG: SUMF1/EgtB/PvdO family nonheme iron enzyme [Planctomycetota bacterium]
MCTMPGSGKSSRGVCFGASVVVASILALTSLAHGALHAVILSVPECRSARYPLPVARTSTNLMRRTLNDGFHLPLGRIYTYREAEVTRAAVREILRDRLPRELEAGDRLILYYAGHGSLGLVAGTPVRLYFTYETTPYETEGGADEGEAGAGWDPDTVITDFDLQEWLGPLHEMGVTTLFLRECCFNGGGYSEAIRDAAPVSLGKPREVTVATYELSACTSDQGAYAVEVNGESVGAFTQSLCAALAEGDSVITLEDLAAAVELGVAQQGRDQKPVLGGWKKDHFEELELDRSARTFVLEIEDRWDDRPVRGAWVFVEGRAPRRAPATFEDLSCKDGCVWAWVECAGYVPQWFEVPIDEDEGEIQTPWPLELGPEFTLVEGHVVESTGLSPESIRISYEMIGSAEFSTPVLEEDEERPDKKGAFSLALPAGRSCRLLVFSAAQLLAEKEINDGKPLEPLRVCDRETNEWVEREPYDAGTITVSLPSEGATPAQRQFEGYLDRGYDELDGGELQAARHSFEMARELVDRLPEASRARLLQRVARALDRVTQIELQSQAVEPFPHEVAEALEAGKLDDVEALARRVLEIDPELDWPAELLDEVDGIRLRLEVERKRSALSEAGSRTQEASMPAADRAPVAVEGFTYRGKNAQGMHEYLHDATQLEFVYIPGGTFMMGSPLDEQDRCQCETPHQVTVSPYLIAKYELCQEVWERIMGTNPSGFKKGGRYPVENVSWYDALRFCCKVDLELSTEAQWEFACRAGTTTPYIFGASITTDQVNCCGQAREGAEPTGVWREETVPVDSLQPNAWGLYNMPGNVWEWCWDYHEVFATFPVTDPMGSVVDETCCVVRGGAHNTYALACRSASRFPYVPTYTGYNQIGFRPAKSLK